MSRYDGFPAHSRNVRNALISSAGVRVPRGSGRRSVSRSGRTLACSSLGLAIFRSTMDSSRAMRPSSAARSRSKRTRSASSSRRATSRSPVVELRAEARSRVRRLRSSYLLPRSSPRSRLAPQARQPSGNSACRTDPLLLFAACPAPAEGRANSGHPGILPARSLVHRPAAGEPADHQARPGELIPCASVTASQSSWQLRRWGTGWPPRS
jgi:hypothetical protein